VVWSFMYVMFTFWIEKRVAIGEKCFYSLSPMGVLEGISAELHLDARNSHFGAVMLCDTVVSNCYTRRAIMTRGSINAKKFLMH
jgi:hypothetical protein